MFETIYHPSGAETDSSYQHFRKGIDKIVWPVVKSVSLTGLENLKEIPEDKPIILAVDHTADYNLLTAVKALAEKFHIGIANMSNQFDFLRGKDKFTTIGINWLGKNNFYGIDYDRNNKGRTYPRRINLENFDAMAKAMREEGKTIAIAAHRPAYDFIMPDRGANGPIILAQLAGALVVPVAVDLNVDKSLIGKPFSSGGLEMVLSLKRHPAEVSIGKPIELPPIQNLREAFTPDDPISNDAKRAVFEELRIQSSKVMESIAKMLPSEQRGKWLNSPNPH